MISSKHQDVLKRAVPNNLTQTNGATSQETARQATVREPNRQHGTSQNTFNTHGQFYMSSIPTHSSLDPRYRGKGKSAYFATKVGE